MSDPAQVASEHVPKVVVSEDGRLVYASRSVVPFHARGRAAVHRRQVCIYAFGRPELERFAAPGRRSTLGSRRRSSILRCVDLGSPVHMVEVRAGSQAVDVPADVGTVEALLHRERADAA